MAWLHVSVKWFQANEWVQGCSFAIAKKKKKVINPQTPLILKKKGKMFSMVIRVESNVNFKSARKSEKEYFSECPAQWGGETGKIGFAWPPPVPANPPRSSWSWEPCCERIRGGRSLSLLGSSLFPSWKSVTGQWLCVFFLLRSWKLCCCFWQYETVTVYQEAACTENEALFSFLF